MPQKGNLFAKGLTKKWPDLGENSKFQASVSSTLMADTAMESREIAF